MVLSQELVLEQHLGLRWGHQEGRHACLVYHLEDPVVGLAAGQVQMEAFGEEFATCATLGFQSFLVCEDGAGEGAASADLAAGVTLRVDLAPLAAEALMMGAGGTETVGVPPTTRKECSTSTVASGWEAGRRWASHVGHAVGTGQTLASLTEAYGKKLGESPIGSWLRPP
jgi:hypothetical protein